MKTPIGLQIKSSGAAYFHQRPKTRNPPASAKTSAPAPVPTAQGPLAYYIMQGTFIISPPYTDTASCMKALAKIQKDPQPGKDMIVCAHRRP